MDSFRFDMWQGGRKILLRDVLESFVIPKDVAWSLLDFSGSGVPPTRGRMEDFEAEVQSVSSGLSLSAEQLDQFATDLTDITDIQLVGKYRGQSVMEIRGQDSTFWEVAVDGVSVVLRERKGTGSILEP